MLCCVGSSLKERAMHLFFFSPCLLISQLSVQHFLLPAYQFSKKKLDGFTSRCCKTLKLGSPKFYSSKLGPVVSESSECSPRIIPQMSLFSGIHQSPFVPDTLDRKETPGLHLMEHTRL